MAGFSRQVCLITGIHVCCPFEEITPHFVFHFWCRTCAQTSQVFPSSAVKRQVSPNFNLSVPSSNNKGTLETGMCNVNNINEPQRIMVCPDFFSSSSPCLDHHRYDASQDVLVNAATLNYSLPLQIS